MMRATKTISCCFYLPVLCTVIWQSFEVAESFTVRTSLPTTSIQNHIYVPSRHSSSLLGLKASWNQEHLAHGASEIHEETADEVKESEQAAAWDAHDAPDAGMEAAAEERAVMLAAELMHKMKQKKIDGTKENNWNKEHLAHGASEIHEETADELKESEQAAAWDAHDAPDAGMEAAAEERAVMLAAELMHKMKPKKATKRGD